MKATYHYLILLFLLFALIFSIGVTPGVLRIIEGRDREAIPTETVPEETEPEYFGKDITFAAAYVQSEDVMPYALFTPSTAADGAPVPLILFLHGKGEFGGGEQMFMNAGLAQVMGKWEAEGFRAYVICPHMTGKWNPGYWSQEPTAEQIRNLLDKFMVEHNVDPDRIILAGFSSGSIGAQYMALQLPAYFTKLVILSGLKLEGYDASNIRIPAVGCGENMLSYGSFMRSEFPDIFGEENVFFYNADHVTLPRVVFHTDADGNGRPDLIEWMLCDRNMTDPLAQTR